METSKIYDLCIREVAANIILRIKEGSTASQISKEINGTFSHVSKIVGALYDAGYIDKKKRGREVVMKPTQKLIEAQELLIKLQKLF